MQMNNVRRDDKVANEIVLLKREAYNKEGESIVRRKNMLVAGWICN